MKKTVTHLLVLMLSTVLLLSACTSSTPAEEEKGSSSETSKYDFNGDTLIILQNTDNSYVLSFPETSTIADSVKKRLSDLETELNTVFSLKYENNDAIATYIQTNDSAGIYYADIVACNGSAKMRVAAGSGAFTPIDDVSEILDYHDHDKWGSVEILESMMVKGILYAVCPQEWIDWITLPLYTLVYNRTLVTQNFNMADPHELYEQQKWTRDALEEYILSCTAVEEGNTSIYGLSASPTHLTRQAILSNGCQMVETDENGNITCGWTGENAVEALTWVQTLLCEHRDSVMFRAGSSDWDSYIPFNEERASFLLTAEGFLFSVVAYEVDNFGLMPWPSGSNLPYGQWVGYYETSGAASIPTSACDTEHSAIAIDRIFEPMEEYQTFEDIKNYYATNVLYDPLDVEILFENRNNPLTQYCYWPDGGDDFLYAIKSVTTDRNASPVEAIETNKGLLEKVIAEQISPNREALDNYR